MNNSGAIACVLRFVLLECRFCFIPIEACFMRSLLYRPPRSHAGHMNHEAPRKLFQTLPEFLTYLEKNNNLFINSNLAENLLQYVHCKTYKIIF